jgi:hypothetical protein
MKPGKNVTLPSSYRPINLLDTVEKLFQVILLTGVIREVNKRCLLRDQQFWFQARHSTVLQLAHLVESVSRNFNKMMLTCLVFLDVAKTLDILWVEGLFCKLTI